MEELDTKCLVLDISSNLTRIGYFALQNNKKRVRQFLKEIEECSKILNSRKTPKAFKSTLKGFNQMLSNLKSSSIDKYFADDVFTYSNILMHRVALL
jgi:hypothetical protein